MTPEKTTGDLNWPVIVVIAGIHAMALLSFWHFTWSSLLIFIFFYWLSGWIGITLGYHRLLTHGSFKTHKLIKWLATIAGLLALQGGPVSWVANHRLHHQHADEEGDPHSPKDGFDWAHIFWLFYKWPCGQKETRKEMKRLTQDLHKDPVMVFLDKVFWLPQIALTAFLFLAGRELHSAEVGISWVLWGVGLRTMVVYHATWATNSIGHRFGYRNYNTPDDSRNIWWGLSVFLLGGEGWHNGHHADQCSAAHGTKKGEHDPTYWTILLLSFIGLAWDVRRPDFDKLKKLEIPTG